MKDMHYKRIKVIVKRRSYSNQSKHACVHSSFQWLYLLDSSYYYFKFKWKIEGERNEKSSQDKKLNTSIASHCSRQCIQKQINAGRSSIRLCCVQITYVL